MKIFREWDALSANEKSPERHGRIINNQHFEAAALLKDSYSEPWIILALIPLAL